ncbi:hypothetical protein HK102_007743 [Quaeritorhiza haematococci]|nr:hypothetical protein HK102_007743 [Quaeritorhiza haematococci]
MPGGMHCAAYSVTRVGLVADLMLLAGSYIVALAIFACEVYIVCTIIVARHKNWQVSMGINKYYMYRFLAMLLIGTVTSLLTLVSSHHILFPSLSKLQSLRSHTTSEDALPDIIFAQLEEQPKHLYVAWLAASLNNWIVFALFGTTKSAVRVYLGVLRRVLGRFGVPEEVVAKVS